MIASTHLLIPLLVAGSTFAIIMALRAQLVQ